MRSTRGYRHIRGSRSAVYHAMLDARSVVQWKVPADMTSEVHAFDAREGRAIRVSLTCGEPTAAAKTSARTDTYHGRFVKLVPNEKIVEVDEFEMTDPALRGEMTITIALIEEDGGTDLHAVHEGLPLGASLADIERGWVWHS